MANHTSRGQQRDKPFRDALRMELAAAGEDSRALRKIARALLNRGAMGDIFAIREIADRIDGKVPHPVSGISDTAPLELRVVETSIRRHWELPPSHRRCQTDGPGS